MAAPPFDLDTWLGQWRDWMTPMTDRLLQLDDRTQSGTTGERDDVAAAFVARKAINDRLDAVESAMDREPAEASTLTNQPVVDDSGGAGGSTLDDAARLLEAIIAKVEREVADREGQHAADTTERAAIVADLDTVTQLSATLGERTNQVADLRAEAQSGRDPGATAAALAALRRDLEVVDAERRRVLARWHSLPGELESLATEEVAVRELAARCREKIATAPSLAVPSVDVLSQVDRTPDLDEMPWRNARATAAPLVAKVDRLSAALAEARRRFEEPLSRRDDLRGLLQSFRQKAAAKGLGEHPAVETRYRRAESLLWAAPCDLEAAGPLVDEFVATVNTMTAGVRR
ncbi:hypothetical protein BH24ACT6_BH24ACT6_12590 [soil metagenome]